ncbi:MAG: hypothetical protein H6744_08330 [Deltaproteobacteria bacterium]|nr:hypothetical protein [Deltaproteobacteria bacterium]MCB9786683.1 hypothetical protein [Deltaproteobacteria bacterium]
MPIHPDHRYYARTSRERLASADLLRTSAPSLSLYLAGLSAECMLRAWLPPGEPFDGRHDLASILARGSLLEGLTGRGVQKVTIAVKGLTLLWFNGIRYLPEDQVLPHLKRLPAYRKMSIGRKAARIVLTRAASDALAAATVIMKAGEVR